MELEWLQRESMIHLQLHPELEAQLKAEAQQHGLALDKYIEKLVSGRGATEANQHSVGGAIDRIRELRKGSRLGDLNLKDLIHERHKH